MRLSDLTTDETLDVLCEITPCVERIIKDEAIIEAIGKAVDTTGMTRTGVMVAGIEKIGTVIPMLLKNHRPDLYHILGSVNRVEPAEIAAQKLTATLAQINEVIHDEELLTFFRLFGRRGRREQPVASATPRDSGREE